MTDTPSELTIESLTSAHDVTGLGSGAPELDRWLAREAGFAEQRGAARVYVFVDEGVVIAYSALTVSTLGRSQVSSRASGGLSVIPAILLGKLAVSRGHAGRGLGSRLLGHAGQTALDVASRVGARLLVTEARDDESFSWYQAKGMRALSDGRTAFVRLADLRS